MPNTINTHVSSAVDDQQATDLLTCTHRTRKTCTTKIHEMNTQGQQQQTSPQGQPVLYGIPLSGIDFETQKLIQKVMRAATAIFVTVILVAIINLLNGESFIVVAGMIFIAGAVVSCGYYGARDRNVSLLNTFTACNACAGVCHTLLMHLYILVMNTVNAVYALMERLQK